MLSFNQVVSEHDATEDMVAMCYVFTVRARLTPKWNSVDNFLVQGVLRPVPHVSLCSHM